MDKIYTQNDLASNLVAFASAHSMMLYTTGKVECIKSALLKDSDSAEKYDLGQTEIDKAENVVAVAADFLTSFALRSDGSVTYKGKSFPEIDKITQLMGVKAIACGASHIVALLRDGNVVAYGENNNGACNVASWSNIKKIVCSTSATFGICEDGTVVACGDNKYGACDVSAWKDIVNIFTGSHYTVGIQEDGKLVYCGEIPENVKAAISNWEDVVSIAGDSDSCVLVALKKDGTAVCCNEYGKEDLVDEWKNLIAVFSGDNVFVGLREDGYLVAVNVNTETFLPEYADPAKDYCGKRLFVNLDNIEEEREAGFESAKLEAQNAAKQSVQTKPAKKKAGNSRFWKLFRRIAGPILIGLIALLDIYLAIFLLIIFFVYIF